CCREAIRSLRRSRAVSQQMCTQSISYSGNELIEPRIDHLHVLAGGRELGRANASRDCGGIVGFGELGEALQLSERASRHSEVGGRAVAKVHEFLLALLGELGDGWRLVRFDCGVELGLGDVGDAY